MLQLPTGVSRCLLCLLHTVVLLKCTEWPVLGAWVAALIATGILYIGDTLPFAESANPANKCTAEVAQTVESCNDRGAAEVGERVANVVPFHGEHVVLEQRYDEVRELIRKLREARRWTDLALQSHVATTDDPIGIEGVVETQMRLCRTNSLVGSGGADFRSSATLFDVGLQSDLPLRRPFLDTLLAFDGRELTSPNLEYAQQRGRCNHARKRWQQHSSWRSLSL